MFENHKNGRHLEKSTSILLIGYRIYNRNSPMIIACILVVGKAVELSVGLSVELEAADTAGHGMDKLQKQEYCSC